MLITKTSNLTGKINSREIPVTAEAYEAWRTRRDTRMVQDAFPELSAEDREFLLSGITPEEWSAAFD